MLDAAGADGAELLERMPDARSLLPLARGESASVRDHAVCLYRNSGLSWGHRPWDPPIHATMFRDERYKLNLFHGPAERLTPDGVEGQLFDMERDPHEMNDLWASLDHAAVRGRLMQRLAVWASEQSWTYEETKRQSLAMLED
jgi:arylsulfatase